MKPRGYIRHRRAVKADSVDAVNHCAPDIKAITETSANVIFSVNGREFS